MTKIGYEPRDSNEMDVIQVDDGVRGSRWNLFWIGWRVGF